MPSGGLTPEGFYYGIAHFSFEKGEAKYMIFKQWKIVFCMRHYNQEIPHAVLRTSYMLLLSITFEVKRGPETKVFYPRPCD